MAIEFDESPEWEEYEDIVESEFCFGMTASLSIKFFKNWQLQTQFDYLTVYTNKRIHLHYLSVGIIKTFETPKWLQDILK